MVIGGLGDPATFCGSQEVLIPLAGELEMNGWMQEHGIRWCSSTGGLASWASPDPTPSVSLGPPVGIEPEIELGVGAGRLGECRW